jgi:hypothetical protein
MDFVIQQGTQIHGREMSEIENFHRVPDQRGFQGAKGECSSKNGGKQTQRTRNGNNEAEAGSASQSGQRQDGEQNPRES